MNFDGVLHNSTGVTTNERARVANRPAVPSVLSGLLVEALVYLREHAQVLAVRSFAVDVFVDASPRPVSTVRAAWVPPHATALVCVINSAIDPLFSPGPGYPLHFLCLVGGSGNIDSDLVQGPSSSDAGQQAVVGGFGPTGETYLLPLALSSVVYLPLVSADLAAEAVDREALTMELWGHALLDDGSGAAEYVAMAATFYWLSEY